MRQLIVDIETNGLDITGKIHCIGCKLVIDNNPQPTQCFTSHWTSNSDGPLSAFISLLRTCDQLITFNGVSFDVPYMSNYFNMNFNIDHLDIMLLAKIMFPKDHIISMDYGIKDFPKELYGSFSLAAFGHRLGHYKDHHDDWSKLTTEMVDYCKQDIEVTYQLYNKLSSMENYPEQKVIDIEHSVASIIADQERAGFYFDVEAARKLNTKLLFEKNSIAFKLAKTFKPRFLPDGKPQKTNKLIKRKHYLPDQSYISKWTAYTPYRIPLKRYKSGKIRLPSKTKFKWFETPHKLIYIEKEGEFQNIKLTKFNPGSRQHIEKWLKHMYNWKPIEYTASGNPKVDADTLEALPYESAQPLKRYLKVVKDLGQLSQGDNSLLNLVGTDSRFHGRVDTLGANTGRMTHCVPVNYKIKTLNGFKTVDELTLDDYIYSYDTTLKAVVLNKLEAINKYTNTPIGRLTNDNLSFECTSDHRWVTVDGIKKTSDIIPIDKLIL